MSLDSCLAKWTDCHDRFSICYVSVDRHFNTSLKLTASSGHSTPANYPTAVYTKLKIGTKVNSTHWQVTAKCSGCSTFIGSTNTQTTLPPQGVNRLAFAESGTKPATPSSSTSSFGVHEVTNSWSADFATAGNADFAALVTKNGEVTI